MTSTHPRIDEAVAAMDAGNLETLGRLLVEYPDLVSARTNLEPPTGYFTGAMLLHHVAGNPDRRPAGIPPLPAATSVALARVLLDAGADVHAATLGPPASDTMGLVITSKQASDAGLSGPLMDLLLERGARLELKEAGALDRPLANHAPGAAEKMISLGAEPDVMAFAALGWMDQLREAFDPNGRLRRRPWRRGVAMPEPDAIGLALLFAYVRHQDEAVEFLLAKDGNWNMIGVNNGTALHRAAWSGDLAMVQRLVAKGADVNDRNNPFNATPLSWAHHNKQDATVRWIAAHAEVDLHDAVGFDLPDQIRARLQDDPASVNRRLTQWQIPMGTPLHCAAAFDRESAARLLLESGADPNITTDSGLTPLDLAREKGSAAIAALLERHGGRPGPDR